MSFRTALILFTLAFLPPKLIAGTPQSIATAKGSGVKITVRPYYDACPRVGYFPLQIVIENFSGSARTWNGTFSTGRIYGVSNTLQLQQSFAVPNNAVRTFDILAPLAPAEPSGYSYSHYSVVMTGYGTREAALTFQPGNHGSSFTQYVAISNPLATRSWELLVKELGVSSGESIGTHIDPAFLPADWRGYLGISSLFMTDIEWAKLAPEVRLAIKDWLAQGGKMVICGEKLPPPLATEFGFEMEKPARFGLGEVAFMKWSGGELDVAKAAALIRSGNRTPANHLAESTSGWKMLTDMGDLKLNAPFLITFMSCFAALIGPANLFWFARSGVRHRLFWTTPLIAVIASGLLMLFIFLQDGLGGSGKRLLFVVLLPDHKELVMQEQTSRTGVVLASHFKVPSDVFLSPVNTHLARGNGDSRQLSHEGDSYSGDWFPSRSIQAHFAERIRTTRSRVELLNPAEVKTGAAPVLLSSVGDTLRELHFLDEKGNCWRGDDVKVGQKITLKKEGNRWYDLAPEKGAMISAGLGRSLENRNYFYAITDDVSTAAIETLPSIRWKSQRAIYAGAVISATP